MGHTFDDPESESSTTSTLLVNFQGEKPSPEESGYMMHLKDDTHSLRYSYSSTSGNGREGCSSGSTTGSHSLSRSRGYSETSSDTTSQLGVRSSTTEVRPLLCERKKISKKLRQIEKLSEKQANRMELNQQETGKLSRKSELDSKMDTINEQIREHQLCIKLQPREEDSEACTHPFSNQVIQFLKGSVNTYLCDTA